MRVVETKVTMCPHCGYKTLHTRRDNTLQVRGVLLHTIIGLLTIGVWWVIMLVGIVFNLGRYGWVCKDCIMGVNSNTQPHNGNSFSGLDTLDTGYDFPSK